MVKLKENKVQTEHSSIEPLPLPPRVYLPLSQHIGKPTSFIVKVGDEVLVGQKIADSDAAITSPVHASISGKISMIVNWSHPVIGMCKAAVIDGDGKDELASTHPLSPEEVNRLSPEQIRSIVREAGIVGMGGAGFPP